MPEHGAAIACLLLILLRCPAAVWSHARLMSPPSRSSMWRVGFPTRKNFNDNALYCGGIGTQWKKNGGKCGICGDPYDMPHPRDNEAGGKYGTGMISKTYIAGQVMEATVEVTTNHRGYFEFKLCPNNDPRREASQECLDRHLLKEAHGIGTRYYIGDQGNGDITVQLQLPKDLTCSQCVFQWTYVAGNNWGMCEDGESRLGCGPQETFRGCADIAIVQSTDLFDLGPRENEVHGDAGHPSRPRKRPLPTKPPISHSDRTKGSTRRPFNALLPGSYHHHPQDLELAGQGKSPTPRPFQKRKKDHWAATKRRKYDNRYFHHQANPGLQRPNRKSAVANGFGHPNGRFVDAAGPNFPTGQLGGPGRVSHPATLEEALMRFLNSDSASEEDGLAQTAGQGFNLGGRRYKDFWHL